MVHHDMVPIYLFAERNIWRKGQLSATQSIPSEILMFEQPMQLMYSLKNLAAPMRTI